MLSVGRRVAFAAAFDYALTMKHELEQLLDKKIPIKMSTDSESLFDVITKSSSTTERRLMIDVQAVRNGYERLETLEFGFERNPADSFTKVGSCEALEKNYSDWENRTSN